MRQVGPGVFDAGQVSGSVQETGRAIAGGIDGHCLPAQRIVEELREVGPGVLDAGQVAGRIEVAGGPVAQVVRGVLEAREVARRVEIARCTIVQGVDGHRLPVQGIVQELAEVGVGVLKPSEVARPIKITRRAIGQWIDGDRGPVERIVQKLRQVGPGVFNTCQIPGRVKIARSSIGQRIDGHGGAVERIVQILRQVGPGVFDTCEIACRVQVTRRSIAGGIDGHGLPVERIVQELGKVGPGVFDAGQVTGRIEVAGGPVAQRIDGHRGSAPPSLTGSSRSEFPGTDGTMRCSDALPLLSPHFVSFVWRYHPVRLSSFLPQARRRLGARSFCDWQPPASSYRDGNDRASQVPGQPLCAYALFFDPGRTESIRPCDGSAWPPCATRRRLPQCGNFGAEWHGVGTGCLRFVHRIARKRTQDSLLVAGQALPGGIGYPQGSYERFPRCILHPILLSQASPGAGCVPFAFSPLPFRFAFSSKQMRHFDLVPLK